MTAGIAQCRQLIRFDMIDDSRNIPEYLEFKIFQVTNDSPNAVYEMFEKNDFSNKIK